MSLQSFLQGSFDRAEASPYLPLLAGHLLVCLHQSVKLAPEGVYLFPPPCLKIDQISFILVFIDKRTVDKRTVNERVGFRPRNKALLMGLVGLSLAFPARCFFPVSSVRFVANIFPFAFGRRLR